MSLSSNFSNIDFTAISQFVAETVEASFAPFAAIGTDVSAQVPTGKSVRVYRVGTTQADTIFNGTYTANETYLTGVDVPLRHVYKSWILRDTDVIDGGDVSFAARNIISSHVKQLAGDIQAHILMPLTGSGNATYSASFSSSAWGYQAVNSASVIAGGANWEMDGSNNLILHSSVYRRVLGDPLINNNYALAALTIDKNSTISVPVLGFNLIESNSFPGTPTAVGGVYGVAIRAGGVAFVMRPVAVDTVENDSSVELVSTNTVPEKGFTYTLKSFRRPELGGRQYVIETQAGSAVADPKYVARFIGL